MSGATRTLLAAMLLAIVVPAAASAAPRERAAAPRIVLSVPVHVREGATASAQLRAPGAPAGSRAVVEIAASGRWRRAAAAPARPGRFAVSVDLPAGTGLVRVRALLLTGGRRLAVSAVRSVRVLSAAPAKRPAAPVAPQPSAASAPLPAPLPESTPPAPAPYEGPMYWGAWIDGAPWEWEDVVAFEQETRKPLSLLEFSQPFVECAPTCVEMGFPTSQFEKIRQHGDIPFLSWGSQANPASHEPSAYQLSDLTDGSHDAYIAKFAKAAAAWGHPFFLRFDWEMNGNWFLWGEGANGNLPGEFVAAWKRVHDIFTREGANNVSWVWCPFVNPNPNGNKNIVPETGPLYPGDEYVDWTCLDGYNWGYHPELGQRWRSFSYLFGPTYDEIVTKVAPGKPMLIGETASSEIGQGGAGETKAQWIDEMFAALPSRFPAIRGLVWFDVPDQGHDWPLSTSPAAESSFAAGVAPSRWLGNAFGGLASSPIPPPG